MTIYNINIRQLVDHDIKKIHDKFPELGLTDKQFVVFYMIATGSSDKQIANHTETHVDSVKDHVRAVKRKINCNTRAEIMLFFMTRLIAEKLN